MTTILALDPGRHTGWALGPADGWPDIGVRTFTGEGIGEVAVEFDQWLNELVEIHKPAVIAYERPYIAERQRRSSMQMLMGLAWHIEYMASYHRLPIECPTASEWRSSFLGRGRPKHRAAAKDAALTAAEHRGYCLDASQHDGAEALGVWEHVALKRFPKQAEHLLMAGMKPRRKSA